MDSDEMLQLFLVMCKSEQPTVACTVYSVKPMDSHMFCTDLRVPPASFSSALSGGCKPHSLSMCGQQVWWNFLLVFVNSEHYCMYFCTRGEVHCASGVLQLRTVTGGHSKFLFLWRQLWCVINTYNTNLYQRLHGKGSNLLEQFFVVITDFPVGDCCPLNLSPPHTKEYLKGQSLFSEILKMNYVAYIFMFLVGW